MRGIGSNLVPCLGPLDIAGPLHIRVSTRDGLSSVEIDGRRQVWAGTTVSSFLQKLLRTNG